MYRSFGEWVGQRRSQLGLSQSDFAAKLGYSVDTIRRIEQNRYQSKLNDQLTTKFAAALAIPTEDLVMFRELARQYVPPSKRRETPPPEGQPTEKVESSELSLSEEQSGREVESTEMIPSQSVALERKDVDAIPIVVVSEFVAIQNIVHVPTVQNRWGWPQVSIRRVFWVAFVCSLLVIITLPWT